MTIEKQIQKAVRQQRIERWISTTLVENPTDSSGRRLNLHLHRLAAERQRTIDLKDSDQKMFAVRQAMRHKDNPNIVNTLNYVRQCCQVTGKTIKEEQASMPSIPPAKNRSIRTTQSAHVQHVEKKNEALKRKIISADPMPFGSTTVIDDRPKSSLKKNSLEEFRRHPERFLSPSNRYLPLLCRKGPVPITSSISKFSDGSEFVRDDVKSFLSDEFSARRKARLPPRIDLMQPPVHDSSEHLATLAYLRDREYQRCQSVMQSKSIDDFLEPLSPMIDPPSSNNFSFKPNRIRSRPPMDIDKNRLNMEILIY